jgi:4-oxalocrotonate tautomerase
MPFVNIKVAGPSLTPEQLRDLQSGATALMAEVLRKKRELTAVLVEQVSGVSWSVGAEPLQIAAQVEAKVTQGTNAADEKARFVAEAMRLLQKVLGPGLSPVSYVVVHEVSADAWGYDGRTQADRARP